MDILVVKDWLIEQAPVVVVSLLWIATLLRNQSRMREHLDRTYTLHRDLMMQTADERVKYAQLMAEHSVTLQAIHTTVQHYIVRK